MRRREVKEAYREYIDHIKESHPKTYKEYRQFFKRYSI